ncbi:MAG: prephenate dehydrogenase [Acidimicrobiales bacterium]|nr:prephenate dehydrogenase [Acidimicrobiales bacterium]
MAPRAAVVGTGLIGGSIGLALRAQGWHVSGVDRDDARATRALELGAIDAVGRDPSADLTFVATPVGAVVELARAVLEGTAGVVTDVGSVKGPIVRAVDDPRFVGGHPMAGSEQEGVEGARADLFEGAVWVLTPDGSTDETAYTTVRSAVSGLGAEVVAIPADRHDELVAVVSHVPHLTAATLMALADARSADHRALLRLAAGGFRDMTRVAAGHPGIWPDICAENRSAIVDTLDRLIEALGETREIVASGDRDGLLDRLERARGARTNLPVRYSRPDQLTELRVPVPDRPGALAEVTTLATELDVNIADLELAHSAEGDKGVLLLLVESAAAPTLGAALQERGYVVAERALEQP